MSKNICYNLPVFIKTHKALFIKTHHIFKKCTQVLKTRDDFGFLYKWQNWNSRQRIRGINWGANMFGTNWEFEEHVRNSMGTSWIDSENFHENIENNKNPNTLTLLQKTKRTWAPWVHSLAGKDGYILHLHCYIFTLFYWIA